MNNNSCILSESNKYSLEDRFNDRIYPERCIKALFSLSIAQYFDGYDNEMYIALSTPGAKEHELTPFSPLEALLATWLPAGTKLKDIPFEYLPDEYKDPEYQKRSDPYFAGEDLANASFLKPLSDCDYRHPMFNFSMEGLQDLVAPLSDIDLTEDTPYETIVKTWPCNTINNIYRDLMVKKKPSSRRSWVYHLTHLLANYIREYDIAMGLTIHSKII